MVTGIPRDNKTYHVIFVLHIDESHDYDQQDLATYSSYAESRLSAVAKIATVKAVENYFAAYDALSADDLRDLLE
jgi:hypothetical protein